LHCFLARLEGIQIRILLLLFVTVSFLDLFTQLPIISPMAISLGAAPLLVGLAVGMYSFTNMFGNMVGGMGIDRFGAKWVLMTGMLVTAFNLLLYTTVATPVQLIVVRLIHGTSSGLLAPSAFALMAQAAKEGQYGRTMAHTGAIVGFSAIIGPAFGGIISAKFGFDSVFYSVSVLMVLSAILVWLFAPMPKHRLKKEKSESSKGEFKSLLACRPLTNTYWGSFALFFTLGVVTVLLPIRAAQISPDGALGGMMISTFGVVAILVFLLPTNKMYDYFNPQKILTSGMFTVAMSQAFLAVSINKLPIFLSMGVFGLGFALMFPAMTTIIMNWVPIVHRGKAFGIFYACFSLGVVVGSFSVGLLKASPEIGFIISSVIVFLMALYVRYRYLYLPDYKGVLEEKTETN